MTLEQLLRRVEELERWKGAPVLPAHVIKERNNVFSLLAKIAAQQEYILDRIEKFNLESSDKNYLLTQCEGYRAAARGARARVAELIAKEMGCPISSK